MKLDNISSQAYRANYANRNNQPSFGAAPGTDLARKAFETIGEHCNIDHSGSLTRLTFFITALVFLVGARFWESRGGDEKREVVTRDIPAVALSCAGAPLLNQAAAYGVTKLSGVPIVTNGKNFSFSKLGFSSQKQLTDWYSNLKDAQNPLINLSEMVERYGGNIRKVIKKFGFAKELDAITAAKDNATVLGALKDAQQNGAKSFEALEDLIKNVSADNKVLKFAKNWQAGIKIGGIGMMAAVLGYFLPHLNIITTKKKYQKQLDEGKMTEADFQKKIMRTSTIYKSSAAVLSFHNKSAIHTFKNLLSMAEPSSRFE